MIHEGLVRREGGGGLRGQYGWAVTVEEEVPSAEGQVEFGPGTLGTG